MANKVDQDRLQLIPATDDSMSSIYVCYGSTLLANAGKVLVKKGISREFKKITAQSVGLGDLEETCITGPA